MPLLRNKGHKKSGVPFLPAWGVKKRRHGRYMKLSWLGVICVLPSLGVWLSRCCAYQGSFLKSSKSVVNSLSISAKVPVFQGFSEIIKVVQREQRKYRTMLHIYWQITQKTTSPFKEAKRKRPLKFASIKKLRYWTEHFGP